MTPFHCETLHIAIIMLWMKYPVLIYTMRLHIVFIKVFLTFQNAVLELRDEMSELKTDRMRKDAHISQLELILTQKSDDIAALTDQVRKVSRRSPS